MRLRWLVRKYPKASIDEVKDLRDRTGQGIEWCKKQLNKPDETFLQVYVPYCNVAGKAIWVDVPIEIEEIPNETI